MSSVPMREDVLRRQELLYDTEPMPRSCSASLWHTTAQSHRTALCLPGVAELVCLHKHDLPSFSPHLPHPHTHPHPHPHPLSGSILHWIQQSLQLDFKPNPKSRPDCVCEMSVGVDLAPPGYCRLLPGGFSRHCLVS